jgi:hypothetical protein
MDTKSGMIHEMNEADIEALKKAYDGRLTELNTAEHMAIKPFPQERRPEELALIRFLDEREKLGAPCGLWVQNAFRLGYLAALKDQK